MVKGNFELDFLTIVESTKAKFEDKRITEELLTCLCNQLVLDMECPGVFISRRENGQALRLCAAAGCLTENGEDAEWNSLPFVQDLSEKALQTGKVKFLNLEKNEWDSQPSSWQGAGIKSLLFMPVLSDRSDVVGVITVTSTRYIEEYKRESIELMTAFSVRASAIISLQRGKDLLDKYLQHIESAHSNHQEMTAKVSFLASHDSLTGLLNRNAFSDKLREMTESGQEKLFAVFFLDIDRFKFINDNYGQDMGDLLLIQVVERIKRLLLPEDIFCRYGEDEFAILIKNRKNASKIYELVSKIINRCYQRFRIRRQDLYISLSVGIAMYPENGKEADYLLKHAHIAMYIAKQHGGNRFQVYLSEKDTKPFQRYTLLGDLNKALKRGEFRLYYQPLLDVRTGKVNGMEALLRWYSPSGLINPADFIPLAEETGLIVPIGEWVIRTACEQNKKWQEENKDLKMSVNISAKQFYHPDFVSNLNSILVDTRLNPKLLNFEITESIAMKNFELASRIIQEMSDFGISVTIDDFGTGYSSLNYLANLNLDYLKIDKSLIKDLHKYHKKSSVVKGIINIAHNLGIKVVAEGVEKNEELDFLTNHDCDLAQGYLIGYPLPIEQISEVTPA